MFWRRVVPAALLGPAILWLAARDPVPAYLLGVGLCVLVGGAELYRLLWRAGHRPAWPIGLVLALMLVVDSGLTGPRWSLHLIVLATLTALAWVVFRAPVADSLSNWALTIIPALYVGGLLSYYILLRQVEHGGFWVQTVLVCTWAADIAAYLVGRRWGRTKLAPEISPGKSLEGTVAGVGAALLAALGLSLVAPPLARTPAFFVGLGLLLGVAALMGDLLESFIKRRVGAKDASGLLLGHGGLLDRLDSLLVTGMVGYWYISVLGG
jgi:phosphatidate cytidylyltransferase